jgi:pyridinium-3,5-bisthiocarboxylic acid mononucleotide nickel chelatase
MNIIYFDPVMGISGDMTISALVDAGCPFEVVMGLLSQLPIEMPTIEPEKKRQGAVAGTYLRIGESHSHFSLNKMIDLIGGLEAEERVKKDALSILDIIASAENKAHGVPKEDVHFHELSHIDTIIDILSVAQAMAYFKTDKVLSGPAPHGRGLINTAHGMMPNPPPATAEILIDFPVVFIDEEGELTTPTGAAILKHYVKDRLKLPFTIKSSGYGFGTKEMSKPNVLRVFVGETEDIPADQEAWVIEADMDDVELEYMGVVIERLLKAGAHDALFFPVQMKKGRGGLRLSVTAPTSALGILTEKILTETSTFGVRFRPEFRRILTRKEQTRQTSFGPVRVKTAYNSSGGALKTHIEFDDVVKLADELGLSYRELIEALKKEL